MFDYTTVCVVPYGLTEDVRGMLLPCGGRFANRLYSDAGFCWDAGS